MSRAQVPCKVDWQPQKWKPARQGILANGGRSLQGGRQQQKLLPRNGERHAKQAAPTWMTERVRVLAASKVPVRLELRFGGFAGCRDGAWLESLCRWLSKPGCLVRKAQAALQASYESSGSKHGKAPGLACWADFRGAGVGDEELCRLLRCFEDLSLRVERLWLSENSISLRSEEALHRLTVAAGLHMQELHIANNELGDASVFSLLSAVSATTEPSAGAPVWVFLSGNTVQDPTAVLERLHRAGASFSLDDSWTLKSGTASKSLALPDVALLLPDFCFQDVDSELPIDKHAEERLFETLASLSEALGTVAWQEAAAPEDDSHQELRGEASPVSTGPGSAAGSLPQASQQDDLAEQAGATNTFAVGDRVEYWSENQGKWLNTRIKAVNYDPSGAVASYNCSGKAQAEPSKLRWRTTASTSNAAEASIPDVSSSGLAPNSALVEASAALAAASDHVASAGVPGTSDVADAISHLRRMLLKHGEERSQQELDERQPAGVTSGSEQLHYEQSNNSSVPRDESSLPAAATFQTSAPPPPAAPFASTAPTFSSPSASTLPLPPPPPPPPQGFGMTLPVADAAYAPAPPLHTNQGLYQMPPAAYQLPPPGHALTLQQAVTPGLQSVQPPLPLQPSMPVQTQPAAHFTGVAASPPLQAWQPLAPAQCQAPVAGAQGGPTLQAQLLAAIAAQGPAAAQVQAAASIVQQGDAGEPSTEASSLLASYEAALLGVEVKPQAAQNTSQEEPTDLEPAPWKAQRKRLRRERKVEGADGS
eukprot:TRINITY_DN90938_c0_g1_i1.p1 TRINITY_DN90938_c0_g1~~TRINITY_DN90938_c0_g1_i1.p1  ORF type:complete len:766 (+),score=172.32 TRINITY_DN90938_c0_g1_i1:45-2342(+)